MINDLIYLFDIEIYNYLFFFLYTEIHYKVPGLLSRYFLEEPEIVADCPSRIEPGYKLPLMILVKDANKYNIFLKGIQIFIYKNNREVFIKKIDINQNIDKYIWCKTFSIDIDGEISTKGTHLINVDINYILNNELKTVTNYNLKSIDTIPLRVSFARYCYPRKDYIEFSDLHYHTHLTDDMVEFGAPFEPTLKAAESMYLQFVCSTDHSYDLDDKIGQWYEKDPKLTKWRKSRHEIQRLNLKSLNFIVPSEEVTVHNSKGENVHALILNNPKFIPGSGDGAKQFFKTKSEYTTESINTQLSRESIYIAAHPFEEIPYSQKFLLNRGKWSLEELKNQKIKGIQILNGSFDKTFFKSIGTWIKLLSYGLKKYIYAGNDAHGNFNYFRQIEVPMIKIKQHRKQILGKCRTGMFMRMKGISGFLDSINNGRCYITNGPMIALYVKYNGTVYEMGSTIKIKKNSLQVKINIEVRTSPEFGPIDNISLFVGVITKSMENNEVEYIRKAKHLTSLGLNYTKDIKVKRDIYIRSYTKTVNNNLAYSNPIWIE